MASPRRTRALLAAPLLLLAPLAGVIPAASAAGPVLTIESSKEYTDPFAGEVLVGQVRNTGDAPAGSVEIDVTWLDAAGQPLGPAGMVTHAAVDVLGSGDAAPFAGSVTPPAGWRSYALTATPTDTAEALDHAFTVHVTSTSTDADGFHHLVGTVTNDNSVAVGQVGIVATLFDSSGAADDLAVEATPANPTLAPGATGTFDLISNASGRPYSTYTVLAQSPTPASTASASPSPAPTPSATDGPTPVAAGPPAGPGASGGPGGPAASGQPVTVTLSSPVLRAGQRVTATYRGAPGTTLQILARTQPAATFRVIGTVTLDATGVATSTHAPQRNTRLTARAADGTPSADQPLVTVQSLASVTVSRSGLRTYTFAGRVYPAHAQRLVSLYRDGILVGQGRCTSTGSYAITRTLGAGRGSFLVRTSSDTYNVGTSSPVVALAVA